MVYPPNVPFLITRQARSSELKYVRADLIPPHLPFFRNPQRTDKNELQLSGKYVHANSIFIDLGFYSFESILIRHTSSKQMNKNYVETVNFNITFGHNTYY